MKGSAFLFDFFHAEQSPPLRRSKLKTAFFSAAILSEMRHFAVVVQIETVFKYMTEQGVE